MAISVVIAEVIGGAIKLLLYTKRPQERPRLTLYQKWDASSFPSMHTSRIIVLALWMIAGFFSFLMTVAAIILVGVVAYSRIALKAHYIRDVVGGIILGIVSWLFVLFFFP
ncbi:MAG: phosphatase PAP2 family protein [Candidatus Niyogibacteria bacterium]|nr:phosphatase PAP2 family protein [Candidatus Niyogibacteria bacterium]